MPLHGSVEHVANQTHILDKITQIEDKLFMLEQGHRGSKLVARLEDVQTQLFNSSLAIDELRIQADTFNQQPQFETFVDDMKDRLDSVGRTAAHYNIATPINSIQAQPPLTTTTPSQPRYATRVS